MAHVNMELLKVDAGTQSRAAINEDAVREYQEAIESGSCFPPVSVYYDGIHYYLADGFHRYFAHKRAKKVSIDADVVPGTLRDALLHSLGANAVHGLRRTAEDKRATVIRMLEDDEWSQWSDQEIARQCHVSQPFVSKLRKEKKPEVKYKTKTGTFTQKQREPDLMVEDDIKHDVINVLEQENEDLKNALAVAKLGESPNAGEVDMLIALLQEEIRILKIENQSLRVSRDQYQDENAQLKKQIAMLKKER